VADYGPVIAVLVYVPVTLIGFMGIGDGFMGIWDLTEFILIALLGPAVTTALLTGAPWFQRVVKISTTMDGIWIERRGIRTTILLHEIHEIAVYAYPRLSNAYGLDILRKDGSRFEVREWNPSQKEANLARDRLRFLIEDARLSSTYRT
jgi:hypothetical protein